MGTLGRGGRRCWGGVQDLKLGKLPWASLPPFLWLPCGCLGGGAGVRNCLLTVPGVSGEGISSHPCPLLGLK